MKNGDNDDVKIMSIVGTRPQYIKEAVLSPVLRTCHHEILVNTGQHYDFELSRIQFDVLKIPQPDYNLEVGSGSQAVQTARMMVGIEELMELEAPGLVVLYGDTNTTLAGALAASKLMIPIAHIESGPRQHDMTIPEEINRVITDRLSTLRFVPTELSALNLEKEGITEGVHVTGDVMYDLFIKTQAECASSTGKPEDFGVPSGMFVLLTLHRPHNSDKERALREILQGCLSTSETVLFPVHPRTRSNLERFGMLEDLERCDRMILVKPVHYLNMMMLVENARIVATDSGGLTRESFFSGVPSICLDYVPAWPEIVQEGWSTVTGADSDKISRALEDPRPSGERPSLFGDGKACEKIVRVITDFERESAVTQR